MFIRTKDGIYELTGKPNAISITNNVLYFCWDENGENEIIIRDDEIIKQADTIEELCDEFRYEYNHSLEHQRCWENSKTGIWYDCDTNCELCKEEVLTIKGAIWIEKGLIYVAKMNQEGNLELL